MVPVLWETSLPTTDCFTREQRLETLDRQFQELEEHYKSVLEKVAAS